MADLTNRSGANGERERERQLHDRLLRGDPTAPSELAETYLDDLARSLRDRFPKVDPHIVETAAMDSVLNLAKAPRRYDPDRASLLAYLRMDASGDIRNALQAENRRSTRRAPLEDVELGPRARNLTTEDSDPETVAIHAEEAARLRNLYQDLDQRDREGVQLMADGERRTPVFAEVLGYAHLTPKEQAHEVKRWKDRLVKRLRRRYPQGLGDA